MPREIVTQDGKAFSYRDYSLPALGAHEVRVQVEFAAPKHGTESHVISGSAFNEKRWDAELRLFVPRAKEEMEQSAAPTERGIGNIVVGRVSATGAEVTRFAVGDRVFGYGSIREEHQADEKSLRPLQGLSYANAVCTDPAHVALVAVRDGNIRIGDRVAIFGLGAIGLLTVQMARASGARQVFAVDPFPLRREYASAHGADCTYDPTSTDVALEIKRATGNAGVDVSVETSGNGRALHEAIRCIRQCGTVVHVPWGPKSAIDLHLDEEFHLNRPTIIGSQAVWDNPDRSHPLWTEERARQTAIDLLRDGLITGEGIVTPIVPFDEAAQALAAIFTAPESTIKVGVSFTA
ncbi:MAG: zinc-binding dehydrogenase [Abitibacteriaceae bacterium]|nr:zinc-binding dehydrogenase [Abditibacteriaceae bacterium]